MRRICLFYDSVSKYPDPAIVPIYRKLIGVKAESAKEHLRVFSDKDLIDMLRSFFIITDVKYTNFTTIIDRTLGFGYEFDRPISEIERKLPLLHYLAASVWVKVTKKNDYGDTI